MKKTWQTVKKCLTSIVLPATDVKGDGQGKLVQNGKFLGVPNYKDRAITEGSIYHVIYYGRNMMGPHATLA
jgi:hypothetical protein